MEASLPSLAYTYLRRLLIDCYRRRLIREEGEHELMRATAMAESAESLLSVREVTEQLERGLARLPEDCREYYRLHVYEGMKTAEISEATGQLYRTVEYRLGVARKQIRNYLRHIS
jgi:RNA polymerase sigma-70 factor (ECF subfamily)